MTENIYKLLENEGNTKVLSFLEAIKEPYQSLVTNLRVHQEIPKAKDQKRYFQQFENKLTKFRALGSELSEMLDEAPFELRHKCSIANNSLSNLDTSILNVILQLNDIKPVKSRYRPEIEKFIEQFHYEYKKVFHVTPKVRDFSLETTDFSVLSTSDLFIPVLAKIMNKSINQTYSKAKNILCPLVPEDKNI